MDTVKLRLDQLREQIIREERIDTNDEHAADEITWLAFTKYAGELDDEMRDHCYVLGVIRGDGK
jgi:hypothetical protein